MSDFSYQIVGSDLQYVEVTLSPGASVIGEQGAMMYMDNKVQVATDSAGRWFCIKIRRYRPLFQGD